MAEFSTRWFANTISIFTLFASLRVTDASFPPRSNGNLRNQIEFLPGGIPQNILEPAAYARRAMYRMGVNGAPEFDLTMYQQEPRSDIPIGAVKLPGKVLRKLQRKKTRSGLTRKGVFHIPTVACPTYFAYQFSHIYGGWHGYIGIPKLPGLNTYEIDVNMTINRDVSHSDTIKLIIMQSAEEAISANYIKWAIRFPYQNLLPKLTLMKFNKVVMCEDFPEPVSDGETIVTMWARSAIKLAPEQDVQNVVQLPYGDEYDIFNGRPSLKF